MSSYVDWQRAYVWRMLRVPQTKGEFHMVLRNISTGQLKGVWAAQNVTSFKVMAVKELG